MKFSSNSVFVILGEPGADRGARESRNEPKKNSQRRKVKGLPLGLRGCIFVCQLFFRFNGFCPGVFFILLESIENCYLIKGKTRMLIFVSVSFRVCN